jgi:hypothetical protein
MGDLEAVAEGGRTDKMKGEKSGDDAAPAVDVWGKTSVTSDSPAKTRRNLLTDFCQNTTFHGIRYVVDGEGFIRR